MWLDDRQLRREGVGLSWTECWSALLMSEIVSFIIKIIEQRVKKWRLGFDQYKAQIRRMKLYKLEI
jgi:hypothetical protein